MRRGIWRSVVAPRGETAVAGYPKTREIGIFRYPDRAAGSLRGEKLPRPGTRKRGK